MRNKIIIIVLGLLPMMLNAQQLTLDSCKSLTLQFNKRIKEAQLKVEGSSEVKKQAFTKYFPQVSGGFVAMKADDYLLQGEIPAANLPVYDGNMANLPSATQFAYFPGMDINLLDYTNLGYVAAVEPVYMGGQIRNGNKLAELSEEIHKHQLLLSQDDALLKTEQQFWTLISLRNRMKTIDQYEHLLDTLHNDVSAFFDAGLVNRSDLLKVEVKQNELKGKRLQLENGIELVGMALCQNMGIRYTPDIQFVSDEINKESIGSYFLQADTAVKNRQEIHLLEKAIAAEKLQKKMVRGEILPQVAVGVQGLYLDVLENQSTNGLLFATVNIPISAWWEGSHKLKEQQIKVDIAENKLQESHDLMVLQIEKAYKELIESYEQISISQKSAEQVEEFLKVSRDNFDAGIEGTSDLLEAQAMFQEAQESYINALCTAKIKLAQYKNTTAVK